jgi:3-hydroxyacyl-[acyl-carrier-protein] dehydratase
MRLEHFNMVDRVLDLAPAEGRARAECLVPETSPVFEGHFPGYPILPGALMIDRMAFLAQVRSAKLRDFVGPGQLLVAEARLVHDGSGYAVASGRLEAESRVIAETEITYRVVPFPTEQLRAAMIEAARKLLVPEELLHAA